MAASCFESLGARVGRGWQSEHFLFTMRVAKNLLERALPGPLASALRGMRCDVRPRRLPYLRIHIHDRRTLAECSMSIPTAIHSMNG